MPSFVSLNLNKDFLRLYHRGRSCAKPSLVVYAMKNRTGLCRVGITTSKKIGNAVQRNRARRVIRASLQEVLRTHNLVGWDFVFVARSKTTRVKSGVVLSAMEDALRAMEVIA